MLRELINQITGKGGAEKSAPHPDLWSEALNRALTPRRNSPLDGARRWLVAWGEIGDRAGGRLIFTDHGAAISLATQRHAQGLQAEVCELAPDLTLYARLPSGSLPVPFTAISEKDLRTSPRFWIGADVEGYSVFKVRSADGAAIFEVVNV